LSFVAKLVSVKDDSINHMHAIATLCWKEFQKILPPVLAALKFSLSEESSAIILELKRMAWSENEDARTCKSKIDFKIISSVYAHSYWDSRQWHKWILSVQNEFVDDESGTIMVTAKTKEEATNLDAFQRLIDKKVMKRLHGENKEMIFNIAVKNADALKGFNGHYEHYKGKTHIFHLNIQKIVVCYIGLLENAIFEADKGVIYNVLNLYAEVKTDEAIGLLTQKLSDLVKKEVPASSIYIDLGCSNGPELKLDDIDSKLNKAFLSSDWTYKKLIRRMRASCFSPQRTPMPDRDEMSKEEIAEHFRVCS
jgi:hypothetical protein